MKIMNEDLIEEILLKGDTRDPDTDKKNNISINVGGEVVVYHKSITPKVGLYRKSIDPVIEEIVDISTEPLGYERPSYQHKDTMVFDVEDCSGIVDAFFMIYAGQIVLHSGLNQEIELSHINQMELEGPLFTIT